jgi:hypothetical protein
VLPCVASAGAPTDDLHGPACLPAHLLQLGVLTQEVLVLLVTKGLPAGVVNRCGRMEWLASDALFNPVGQLNTDACAGCQTL